MKFMMNAIFLKQYPEIQKLALHIAVHGIINATPNDFNSKHITKVIICIILISLISLLYKTKKIYTH